MSTGYISLERTQDDVQGLYPEDWRRLLRAAYDAGWADREARRLANVGTQDPPAGLTDDQAAGLAEALDRASGPDADMARELAGFCGGGGFTVEFQPW